jgi:hypothetical protein
MVLVLTRHAIRSLWISLSLEGLDLLMCAAVSLLLTLLLLLLVVV